MQQEYKVLKNNTFYDGEYSLVPIRSEDRYDIMEWRNEQIYHLRQNKMLTKADQDCYFESTISMLFIQDHPSQILFSYLQNSVCIGYGGLVHIDWENKHAEVSFIMNTSLEKDMFDFHWSTFLGMIEVVAFNEGQLNKIFTYAYDLRHRLYKILEEKGYSKEAVLREHVLIDNFYKDVIIHSKIKNTPWLRYASIGDLNTTFNWAKNKQVRLFSFNQKEIDFDEHCLWFSKKIIQTGCFYYILETINEKIGSIRFDIDSDHNAIISYLIDPDFHGRGFGLKILQDGIQKLLNQSVIINKIIGYVKLENQASIHIFKKLNFMMKESENGIFKFEKKYNYENGKYI